MTTAELAAKVGCSAKTIRKMVAEKAIDFTFVGGPVGFVFPPEAEGHAKEYLNSRHKGFVKMRRAAVIRRDQRKAVTA